MERIPVTNAPALWAGLNEFWARALSTVYPVSNFYVTAQNGQVLAPGSPPMERVYNTGMNQSGDPRTFAGGYQETRLGTGSNELAQLMAASAPNITGGSNININSKTLADQIPLVLMLVGIGFAVYYFLFRRG